MRQRGEPVEEARRRHGEANARLLGEEAGDRGRVAGILLVAERQHAKPEACAMRPKSVIGMPGTP